MMRELDCQNKMTLGHWQNRNQVMECPMSSLTMVRRNIYLFKWYIQIPKIVLPNCCYSPFPKHLVLLLIGLSQDGNLQARTMTIQRRKLVQSLVSRQGYNFMSFCYQYTAKVHLPEAQQLWGRRGWKASTLRAARSYKKFSLFESWNRRRTLERWEEEQGEGNSIPVGYSRCTMMWESEKWLGNQENWKVRRRDQGTN